MSTWGVIQVSEEAIKSNWKGKDYIKKDDITSLNARLAVVEGVKLTGHLI